MFTEHKNIVFKKVSYEKASEKYSIEEISEDGTDDLFQDEPEHYLVHKGNVVIDGPITFGADDEDDVTMHVIDGNLTVNGPFVFNQADYYGGLYVTGSITCENAYVAWDSCLYVGKSMHVKGLLATYLSDAGHFAVKGSLSAGSWLEAADRGCFEIGKKPKARLLRVSEGHYHELSREDDDEDDEDEDEDDDDDDEDEDDDDDDDDDDTYEDEDEDEGEDDDDDDETEERYGFSPRQAVSIKGILHPSLIEDDEDVDPEALGDAIRDGKPLFA